MDGWHPASPHTIGYYGSHSLDASPRDASRDKGERLQIRKSLNGRFTVYQNARRPMSPLRATTLVACAPYLITFATSIPARVHRRTRRPHHGVVAGPWLVQTHVRLRPGPSVGCTGTTCR
jgi:hypothetical protein